MCGIAGLFTVPSFRREILETWVAAMARTLTHRGPDDAGTWVEESAGIALGHQRLSIVDLSPTGRQPMISTSQRYVIAFNGEIYNHKDLRHDLQASDAAPTWLGHSDTETLLAGMEHWGLEATLKRSVGMFAIALWDREERTLTLARDRFGEKPLYYGWAGSSGRAFVFGSELKALRAFPGFDAPVCREALAQYLRFLYVPAPRSMYQGVFKLEPGCLLTIQDAPPREAPSQPLRPGDRYGTFMVRRWWSLAKEVEAGALNPLTHETEALRLLEERLMDSVRIQSLADVPVGAFLSGGIDSSTIAALMQRQSSQRIKTFTIGFDELAFNEAPFARRVAQHLGTDHHEMLVTARMAQDVIPTLPHMYDEPFADSSQIPTHIVCRAARQHVTVALSGDGGDELFGGYSRYFRKTRVWNLLLTLPYPARKTLGTIIASVPSGTLDVLCASLDVLLKDHGTVSVGDKLRRLAVRLHSVQNRKDLYLHCMSAWEDPAALVRSADGSSVREPTNLLDDPNPTARGFEQGPLLAMYLDTLSYLPDDILCKVDRAAMAVGLETRAPFLDHRVAQLAWRMPLQMKIRANQGKWALKKVLCKYIPQAMIERPKQGFSLPISQWLRGPLREWAEAMLDETRLIREGYLNPKPIRDAWHQHLSGHYNWTPKLWSVLMFQAWIEKNGSAISN